MSFDFTWHIFEFCNHSYDLHIDGQTKNSLGCLNSFTTRIVTSNTYRQIGVLIFESSAFMLIKSSIFCDLFFQLIISKLSSQ